MPPFIALIIVFCAVVVLLVRDRSQNLPPDAATWLPVIWLFFGTTRFPSQWLNLALGGTISSERMLEGSPLDAAFFATMVIVGASVLLRRRIVLGAVFEHNKWIVFFFLYCLISVTWSDYPFVALKRFIKVMGHPIMVLIILTDDRPDRAIIAVMKRCAYLILPLSVVFIKYYPQYGRYFDGWTGEAHNNGMMLSKNELGAASFVFGVFFLWHFILLRHADKGTAPRGESLLSLGFVAICVWLLLQADSATSIVTLMLGAAVILLLGIAPIRRHFAPWVITLTIVTILVELNFDLVKSVIQWLGRDPTLTDRTEVWHDALKLVRYPLIGSGFESFWLGERLNILWSKWWWRPNQAHNGYIETYLSLGIIGAALLAGVLLSVFFRLCRQLRSDNGLSRLFMALLIPILFYNYTEAAFKAMHLVWITFILVAMQYPQKTLVRKSVGQAWDPVDEQRA